MIVECICNNVARIEKDSEFGREVGRSYGVGTTLIHLTVGKFYVVYGVQIRNGWLRYFVADDLYARTLYPVAYLAPLFDLADSRVSHCWTLGYRAVDQRSSEVLLTFAEWSKDAVFYERLVDGGLQERRTFQSRKEFMDLEFPNPSVVDVAEALDGGWILCPICDDAWESDARAGMVRCPKCRTVLSNPRFAADT